MDDDEPEEKVYPLTAAKLSKAPSWAMLGFVFGAATVWLWVREQSAAIPAISAAPRVTTTPAPAPVASQETRRVALTRLTTIEAVWEDWGKHAVWDNDLAEVAMVNTTTNEFSDFYEVKRVGRGDYTYFFRSIPALTRREIKHGTPLPKSPLRFTETEAQYQEWKTHGRTERR
ncbi:MAG: hypothetical protein RLZZ15_2054 [Verrucomicrobiota bacterium]|jgi:hypothetical protein